MNLIVAGADRMRAAAILAALALAPLPAIAQNDPLIAKVNGTEVRQSDLDVAEEEIGAQLPPGAPEMRRDYLVTYIADMILVSKAAEDRKLADGADFKRKLAAARTKLLMETLLADEAKTATTEPAMRKVYDEATKQMAAEPEVKASHILVESEAEAKTIVADLKKGGNFAEIAKTKSKDPGAADGGDLGYFTKEQMVPEFADVAFKMDKGQLSDPVKTQFGWHVIKVEDKRTKPVPAYDQVKDQLQTFVQRKAQADFITKLRADAKIERLDAKPADAAKPAEPKKP